MIDLMWPDCSPRFIKALCKLMIKGQSMQYYGAAAKKGADAEGRWLQAKRAVPRPRVDLAGLTAQALST